LEGFLCNLTEVRRRMCVGMCVSTMTVVVGLTLDT